MQEDRLMVSDPVALKHIINNRSFIRAPGQLQMGKLIFGERSVYCAEGGVGVVEFKLLALTFVRRGSSPPSCGPEPRFFKLRSRDIFAHLL
jgi:hypothetical protein